MGRDKALLRLPDGRTALETLIVSASKVANPVFLSVDSDAHAEAVCRPLPWMPPTLLDAAPGQGPLSALAGALLATSAPAVLVLAVDAPLVSGAVLRMLCAPWKTGPDEQFSESQMDDIVVASIDGIEQPMPACYSARLASVAASLVERGERRLRALMLAPGVIIRRLNEAAVRIVDPSLQSFISANTPDEWETLRALSAVV
jgi:molybdopterin-guanine dinucleotide biosynthesis protein A